MARVSSSQALANLRDRARRPQRAPLSQPSHSSRHDPLSDGSALRSEDFGSRGRTKAKRSLGLPPARRGRRRLRRSPREDPLAHRSASARRGTRFCARSVGGYRRRLETRWQAHVPSTSLCDEPRSTNRAAMVEGSMTHTPYGIHIFYDVDTIRSETIQAFAEGSFSAPPRIVKLTPHG